MVKNYESDRLQMASRAGIFAESTQEGVSSGCVGVSVCINKVRKADFWPQSTVRRPLAPLQAPRRSQKNCDPAIKVGYRFEVCDQVAITPSFPRAISREKPSPCDLRDQSECCGCG